MRTSMIIAFSLLHLFVCAHPGGHGDHDRPVNRWQLADGGYVEGDFLHGEGDVMVLESSQGRLVRVSVAALSEQDRALARFRIRRAAAFNRQSVGKEAASRPLAFWMVIASLAGAFLAQWLMVLTLRRVSFFSGRGLAWMRIPSFLGLFLLLAMACRKSAAPGTDTPGPTVPSTIPRTRTTFLDSAFAPYRPAIGTSFDNTWYRVESNGMPAHNMMVGITSWQQQVPIPHAYTGSNSWSIPLQPEYAAVPLSTKSNFMKGAVALAVNGIPIFNALNNRGEDAYAIGELDSWGGHCGRADDYHYHAAPMHLSGTDARLPIAFGLDGFAVYGSKEPDGSTMAALDTCHGHTIGTGTYHYHGTANYPYVIGAMRGKVTLDPATPAPENQILPQAFAKGARPATAPLRGAAITEFKSTGANAYSLTYRIGTKNGHVHYSWDANGKFTYTLVDTAGVSVTNTYQR